VKRSSRPQARAILAQNLRGLRATLGLSQEALAAKAGLHRTYVGSVERQERNVSVDAIEKLANALGVQMADLFRDPPEML